jgi:ABC-type multidrug transport system ATPase subunit
VAVPALAVETFALSKRFRAGRALDSLSLSVSQGSIFGLLGPAGAGKTTALRLLQGIERPSGGHATILGYDLLREAAQIRRAVGATTARSPFYPALSARANLRLLGRQHCAPRTRADELLERVQLLAAAREPVGRLSLGERRRLALAVALYGQPRLLLLDEPTSGLDPAEATLMHTLLRGLADDKLTVLLASSDPFEALRLCSDIAILQRGRTLAVGPAQALLAESAALLVEAEPLPLIVAVAERMGLAVTPSGPRTLAVQAPPEQAPRIVAALVHAGAQVFRVTPRQQSLEERFAALADPDAHSLFRSW